MRNKLTRIALITISVALLTACAWLVVNKIFLNQEPNYDGKPISFWINRPGIIEKDHGPSDFGEFGWMPRIDSNAIPYVIKALGRRESPLSRGYYWCWIRLPRRISNRLPPPVSSGRVRESLTEAIGHMGKVAKPIIPALINELKMDPSYGVRIDAAETLGKIGKDDESARAALIQAESDPSLDVRQEATNALRLIAR